MTKEEFSHVPFSWVRNYKDGEERVSEYVNNEIGIKKCVSMFKDNYRNCVHTYTYYVFYGVRYDTLDALLETYNNVKNNEKEENLHLTAYNRAKD